MTMERPRTFCLEWQLTQPRAQGCRSDPSSKSLLALDEAKRVLAGYRDLVREWGLDRQAAVLSFAGGEPFERQDIFDILQACYEKREFFQYGIMTDGLLLTDESIPRLKDLEVDFFQVSIDGMEKNHDAARGKGAFQKARRAIERLADTNIPTMLSMAVTRKNFKDVPAVLEFASRAGLSGACIRRVALDGRAAGAKDPMISALQARELYGYVLDFSRKENGIPVNLGCEDGIACQDMHYEPAGCSCGRARLAISAAGDVYPCRGMAMAVGNLRTSSLKDIFYRSPKLGKFRKGLAPARECAGCPFVNECAGGARCIRSAYWGRTDKPDPQCWRLCGLSGACIAEGESG